MTSAAFQGPKLTRWLYPPGEKTNPPHFAGVFSLALAEQCASPVECPEQGPFHE